MIVKADKNYILFIDNGSEVYDIRLKGETPADIQRRILHLAEKRWCTDRIRRDAEVIAKEYFSGKVVSMGPA